MEYIQHILHIILHIDQFLISFITDYGQATYVILFAIIFCETGLVVTPFLPGDSLLFAAGSIAAHPDALLDVKLLFVLLTLASILGNKVNYLIGRALGPHIFSARKSWLLNKKHLDEAHRFYQKHGGKTILLARFLPIIRTFAPFVAGIGQMHMGRFAFYNIISAIIWAGSFLYAGYFFGSIPIVKDNFVIVIYAIIIISLLPALIAYLSKKLRTS
ncbi:MAG: hypothetical protein A3F14_05990 [Gammaproteobacteria bacterium RIFCSPHIGHO2_12_FULL_43_28]|nr:MAG: hypothetical protein A3F14_05990 [Gammaproteobacteria bacterium RIFCSPHIGHO2_12_FULL_43_28]